MTKTKTVNSDNIKAQIVFPKLLALTCKFYWKDFDILFFAGPLYPWGKKSKIIVLLGFSHRGSKFELNRHFRLTTVHPTPCLKAAFFFPQKFKNINYEYF